MFRGDQVKDEWGFQAVFSEQGTSASHCAAAKFLDAIARLPGNDGEDSDARGAYTQVVLDEMGDVDFVETWISLPPHARPKSWDNIVDPVCRLRLNLYGHPLAGLYWEQFCTKQLLEVGFGKVTGWECLFVHRKLQLFLSVYVDDFKMAGRAENVPNMWAILNKRLDLEPPVPLSGNTYLGCHQNNVKPTPRAILEKSHIVAETLMRAKHSATDGDEDKAPALPAGAASAASPSAPTAAKVQAYEYDMGGHAEQCIDRYLELAHKDETSLRVVATPCIDDHPVSYTHLTLPTKRIV